MQALKLAWFFRVPTRDGTFRSLQQTQHHNCPPPPHLSSFRRDLYTMDGLQLRDEVVRDRIRAAEEFLDPRMSPLSAQCRSC
jgi:hypothetical protein